MTHVPVAVAVAVARNTKSVASKSTNHLDVVETFTEVRQLLAGKEFASLDEGNAFLATHMTQRNQLSKKDFAGLSSEQIHRFLHFPFESDTLIVFPKQLCPISFQNC